MECKCDMRTKLVGDGCEVCNPAYALDHAKMTIEDLEGELDQLRADIKVLAFKCLLKCDCLDDGAGDICNVCLIARRYVESEG